MSFNIDQDQAFILFGLCLITILFLLGVVAGIFVTHIYYNYWILENCLKEGLENQFHKLIEGSQAFEYPVGPGEKLQ